MNNISWFNQGVLHIEINSERPLAVPLLAVGEAPPASGVEAVLEALEAVYQQGYESDASVEEELQGVVFGGRGDPLLAMEVLVPVVEAFRLHRHGVPVRVATFALVDDIEATTSQLAGAGVETCLVFLPATNPADYGQLPGVDAAAFGRVCQFIEAAVAAGMRVECFAHPEHQKDSRDLRELATALGAVGFEIRPISAAE